MFLSLAVTIKWAIEVLSKLHGFGKFDHVKAKVSCTKFSQPLFWSPLLSSYAWTRLKLYQLFYWLNQEQSFPNLILLFLTQALLHAGCPLILL